MICERLSAPRAAAACLISERFDQGAALDRVFSTSGDLVKRY
jgi:hypothetical protein